MTLVLVDLDGTLLDSSDEVAEAGLFALESVGVEGPSAPQLRARIGESIDSMFREVRDADDRVRVVATMRARLADVAGHPDQVLPGVVDGLQQLRESGFLIAVATNKPTVLASTVLRRAGLRDGIDHVQGSGEHAVKPDPAILLAAQKALGVAAAWMIGDTTIDIAAARGAGVRAVAITSGPQSEQTLWDARPYCVVTDFAAAVRAVLAAN